MSSRLLRECPTVKDASQNPYSRFLVFKFWGYNILTWYLRFHSYYGRDIVESDLPFFLK